MVLDELAPCGACTASRQQQQQDRRSHRRFHPIPKVDRNPPLLMI
jgi:hypothetical protein